MTDSEVNPLAKLYRKKSIWLSLPSGGNYYPSGIDLSVDGEIGIKPMTVKDEIVLKTPDALFNGEALVSIFQSCIPDIKNPREIPACDADVMLIGIRAASDSKMSAQSKCPKCEKEHEYTIDLIGLLSSSVKSPISNQVHLDDSVTVNCQPHTLDIQLKLNIQKFHQIRLQHLSSTQTDLTDEQREEMFKDSFNKSIAITIESTVKSIQSVLIGDDTVVANDEFIKDWLDDLDRISYKKIKDKVLELNQDGLDKSISVTCAGCQHEYVTQMDLNPANFF